MEREHLSECINLYSEVEEMVGKYYSYQYIYKKVLKFTDEEIKEMSEQIDSEKKDPIYSKFYKSEGEDEEW
jgi:hypothetical protein